MKCTKLTHREREALKFTLTGPSRCTRSSSRQSSILKPSKPRQPLQNLNFNSSSNENSPTVTAKIKRRVSFAEKKHVKEFCNSLEDGTVWNNTYEEQDLSNHKTCNFNEENPVVENVCKENVFNNTQESDVQCDCNEVTEKDLNVEDYSSHVTNITEDVDDQDEVLLIEPSVVLHDVAAEESEATCSIDLQSKNNSRVSQSIIVYEDADEKLPEQLPQLSKSNAQNFDCDKLNDISPHDSSMEFTTAITSVIKPADNIDDPEIAEFFIDDKKVDNVSMEMTIAIPSALSNLQHTNVNRISLCTPNLLSRDNDNRTTIFHDLSMDITKAVTDIHKSFDRSMVIQKPQQCKYDITSQDERTKLLNMSMEMTTAIPVNVHSVIKNQERDAINHASTDNNYKILRYNSEAYETSANIDRTRICSDDAMEFTTAITSLPKTLPHNLPQEILTNNTSYTQPTPLNSILDRCRNENLQSNRTTIFHDNSMTMTKVVSSLNTRDRVVVVEDPELDANNQEFGKTMLFGNTSMEMTEAIPMIQIPARSNISMEMTEAVPMIQTPTRSNISMEMTEAVPMTQIPAGSNISMGMTEAVPMTQIRAGSNISMEMTEAVPMIQTLARSNISMEMTEAVPMIQTLARSNISMEMTEAVPMIQTFPRSNISMEITEAVPMIQTLARSNISMEITEAVPMIQISARSNISMEMTEAVPMTQIPAGSNISMEMTEAVPMTQIPAGLNISMEMREAVPMTQIPAGSNISMEMTEAVPMIQIPARSNISMEMTEAVPMTQIPAGSNISMEMIEAVPMSQVPAELNTSIEIVEAVARSQTPVHPNVSIETSEAVIAAQTPARSNIFMEMTEAIPITQIPTRSNISMEMTEAVPMTQIPAGSNISMEMIEAVPMSQVPAELNTSIEIVEAVARSQTPVHPNVSIETSEAVIAAQTPARSNIFMEMTEAIPITQIPTRSNISMEIPEAAPMAQISAQLNTSLEITEAVVIPKAPAESNTSMEIIEPVIISQPPAQSNISMETTEAVAVPQTPARPNMSMEITEAMTVAQTPVQLNASMEITEAVVISQTSQVESLNKNSTKDRKSVLPNSENFGNRDLVDLSAHADNALKDTTATLIPPLLKSDIISGKEDCNVHNSPKYLDDNSTIATFISKIPKLANIKSSMALHELNQQDSASALQENNIGTACATFNSVLNNSSSAVNSKLSKNEHLPHRETQTASHLRRTYTIQPLSNDRTFTADSNENNKILEVNNDTLHCKLNDKESSVLMSNSTDNLQNSELNGSLEQIESIKPPEFMCLDDLSIADQEVNTETNCSSKNANNENEDTSKMEDPHANELEKLRKSQTFLIKRASVSDADNSKFEEEDRVHVDEMQKVQLLDVKDANTDIHVWECSSSTIDETEPEKNPPNLPAENCNLEDQVMECSSSNIKVNDRSTPQGENNDKLIDTPKMEVDNEHHSEEKLRLSLQPPSSCVQENNSIILDPFLLLMNELKVCAKSDHIIWEVYHENIERHLFVIGFISSSLLVAIYLRDPCDITNDQSIREIKMISRLADDAEALISIVHRIILEKLDTKKLLDSYKDREDILPMLNYISMEVKLAMDFMFDVRRLNDINLMEITRDSVSFVSRTNRRKILLNVTIEIKPFDKIESQNISVHCLLGSVREEDVKKLITNIKRDHKFLRRYINDVKDYIYLMEQ